MLKPKKNLRQRVSLDVLLHQTIQQRTFGGVRNLQVKKVTDQFLVSGVARDYYHFQLVIAAVSSVLTGQLRTIRYEIKVES